MVLRARSRLGAKAPTLGFLVDLLDDGYQSAIVCGAAKAAENAGAAIHCFVGGVLGAQSRSDLQRNHVFELANAVTLDGLVILGGTLVNQLGVEALSRYCERYRPLPMCSVGAPIAGMSSVLVDNETGMRSVIEHLLIAHAYRRIAFVRGPLANDEAELRFRVYRDTLKQHGVAFDERLVVVGDFLAQGGSAAVGQLLDERRIPVSELDAIVASNDSMACGVMEALNERGIQVPKDVAVTGFDDVEQARYTDPGLTTVRQPLEEQGREAVRTVLQVLQNAPAKDSLLRADLVIRGSCGCGGAIDHPPLSSSNEILLGFEAMLVSRRQRMLAELARAARGTFAHAGANWEARLVTAVVDDLKGASAGSSIRLFEGFVRGLLERGLDVGPCHDVLDALRHEILACLRKEPERRESAEDLFQDIRLAVARIIERLLGGSRLHVEQWARQLSGIGARLMSTFDLEELGAAVERNFPQLGIASCFVVVYEAGNLPSKFSRLVLAYDRLATRALPCPLPFATENVLPTEAVEDSRRLRNLVIAPLFFKQEIFGYLALEFDAAQVFAYEAIRDVISVALKGAMLIKDVRLRQAELDSAMSQIRYDSDRLSEHLVRMQQLAAEIAAGSLIDPGAIRERLVRALEEA